MANSPDKESNLSNDESAWNKELGGKNNYGYNPLIDNEAKKEAPKDITSLDPAITTQRHLNRYPKPPNNRLKNQ